MKISNIATKLNTSETIRNFRVKLKKYVIKQKEQNLSIKQSHKQTFIVIKQTKSRTQKPRESSN